MKPKFKVGDWVKLRKTLTFDRTISKYVGKTLQVEKINVRLKNPYICHDIDEKLNVLAFRENELEYDILHIIKKILEEP